jgi:serine O-acetyltransferase
VDSRPRSVLKPVQENGSSLRQFIAQIGEDYRVHQRDWTLPGFRAVAVHRFGVWRRGLHPRLLRAPFSVIYNSLYRYVRNHYGIELPPTTQVGRRLEIGHQGGIVIHPRATIGNDCIIRQNVTLGAASVETVQHGPTLMDRVEVGCGAVIMGNIVIGNDVRIGPNSVVTMNIPAGSTLVGSPPRIVQFEKAVSAAAIDKGSDVGAGAVGRENLPDYTFATADQRLVPVPRAAFSEQTSGIVEASPQVKQESRPACTGSLDGPDSAADSRVVAAIYRAIDWINEELPPDRQLTKAPETRLVGRQSVVDSMQLVNLIVAIEREVEDTFGVAVTLADERALSMKVSPFRSIQSLADYIGTLVNTRQL